MAYSRVSTVNTFRSVYGSATYTYDIYTDSSGQVSVRNIRGPRGLIADSQSQVPEVVILDMQEAMGAVQVSGTEGTAISGTVTFTGQTTQNVSIPPGTLYTTNYRVVYTTTDSTVLRTDNATLTGFTVTASSAYGTVGSPKVVSYVVLVATVPASTFGSSVTLDSGDAGSKTITFSSALPNAEYRVVLSPSGFFPVSVVDQTRTGFTILMGYVPPGVETVTVGYDVFV